MSNKLPIWTIYDHPLDYPAEFVARLSFNDEKTTSILRAATLDELRDKLPPDLICMARAETDDPVIVECWL